jgi:hypothetical protein
VLYFYKTFLPATSLDRENKMDIQKTFFILIAVLLVSCSTGSGGNIADNQKTSDCHGFGSLAKRSEMSYRQDSLNYCEAEKIRWEYSASQGRLSILHTRIFANCAAKLRMYVEGNDNHFTIIEKDERDPRLEALCVCTFDTYAVIPGVKTNGVTLSFNGKDYPVDPGIGQGVISVDSTPCWICP